LMKKLEETNDISIIEAIKNIFKSEKKDFWDELTQEQKDEIEESDREIDRGEYFLYEDVMSKYR
jgi:hypothetical protein